MIHDSDIQFNFWFQEFKQRLWHRKRGDPVCSECGQFTEEIRCCEKIPDFAYGRPAVQHHYYKGSACCGADVITHREHIQNLWTERQERKN